MKLESTTLKEIEEDEGKFVSFLEEYIRQAMAGAGLRPFISKPRLIDVRNAWIGDMRRVRAHEPNLEQNGLDHFKRSGHLAFWLRRFTPIFEAAEINASSTGAESAKERAQETFRELLFSYLNEYFAFDIGYNFCLFYEKTKVGGSERANELSLSLDYLESICHLLKFKTLSPHAMAAIYKSLFYVVPQRE